MEDIYYEDIPLPFSEKETRQYFKKMNDGDLKLRETLIKHNIRLVIKIVNRRYCNSMIEKNDLVSIGIIGLIKAVDTFDVEKNTQFSSYAVKCIDNEILMFFRKNTKYFNVLSINKGILNNKTGQEVTLEELLYDDDDFTIQSENREIYKIIQEIISTLTEKEKIIIENHYGFNDDKILTQREIARQLGVSQASISQIENKALEKIKIKLQDLKLIEISSEKKKIKK